MTSSNVSRTNFHAGPDARTQRAQHLKNEKKAPPTDAQRKLEIGGSDKLARQALSILEPSNRTCGTWTEDGERPESLVDPDESGRSCETDDESGMSTAFSSEPCEWNHHSLQTAEAIHCDSKTYEDTLRLFDRLWSKELASGNPRLEVVPGSGHPERIPQLQKRPESELPTRFTARAKAFTDGASRSLKRAYTAGVTSFRNNTHKRRTSGAQFAPKPFANIVSPVSLDVQAPSNAVWAAAFGTRGGGDGVCVDAGMAAAAGPMVVDIVATIQGSIDYQEKKYLAKLVFLANAHGWLQFVHGNQTPETARQYLACENAKQWIPDVSNKVARQLELRNDYATARDAGMQPLAVAVNTAHIAGGAVPLVGNVIGLVNGPIDVRHGQVEFDGQQARKKTLSKRREVAEKLTERWQTSAPERGERAVILRGYQRALEKGIKKTQWEKGFGAIRTIKGTLNTANNAVALGVGIAALAGVAALGPAALVFLGIAAAVGGIYYGSAAAKMKFRSVQAHAMKRAQRDFNVIAVTHKLDGLKALMNEAVDEGAGIHPVHVQRGEGDFKASDRKAFGGTHRGKVDLLRSPQAAVHLMAAHLDGFLDSDLDWDQLQKDEHVQFLLEIGMEPLTFKAMMIDAASKSDVRERMAVLKTSIATAMQTEVTIRDGVEPWPHVSVFMAKVLDCAQLVGESILDWRDGTDEGPLSAEMNEAAGALEAPLDDLKRIAEDLQSGKFTSKAQRHEAQRAFLKTAGDYLARLETAITVAKGADGTVYGEVAFMVRSQTDEALFITGFKETMKELVDFIKPDYDQNVDPVTRFCIGLYREFEDPDVGPGLGVLDESSAPSVDLTDGPAVMPPLPSTPMPMPMLPQLPQAMPSLPQMPLPRVPLTMPTPPQQPQAMPSLSLIPPVLVPPQRQLPALPPLPLQVRNDGAAQARRMPALALNAVAAGAPQERTGAQQPRTADTPRPGASMPERGGRTMPRKSRDVLPPPIRP
ncbi:hypothetical protein [Variovorax sp. KK3]|uniref:hypothetical protein n=1 Tax=Variovorax sp. KK3 TaxID=1855728 RepID=UPI001180525C|nr:hypothetical protein [Variovorax sp. KK3]